MSSRRSPCHSYTLLKNGTRTRQIQALPIGSRRCYLKLTNQRYKCTVISSFRNCISGWNAGY
ncbi:transposase family protein [uncultured Porphyromonas sp.]|uniref:transposase family protein n=1 Tax=uncultured Porphyromonas sp. TaxID=159274 RepID=UPI00342B4972